MAFGAYLCLLVIWLVFVAPAIAGKHPARGWARAAAGLGLAGALYESLMSSVWGVAPIRIDILAIVPLLTVVYLLASMALYRSTWRNIGLAGGVLTLAAAAAFGIAMALTGSGMARSQALHDEGNRLLFAAKFADQESYDDYFGATTDATGGVPVGHWTSEQTRPFTRLVVGGDGRAYLFVRCGGRGTDNECVFGPGVPLEPRGEGFTAELVWFGVGQRTLELDAPEGDTLTLLFDGNPHRLRRTPPSVSSTSCSRGATSTSKPRSCSGAASPKATPGASPSPATRTPGKRSSGSRPKTSSSS